MKILQYLFVLCKQCKDRGISEAWIAIDGSNNDCVAKKAVIAEDGKAKSGKNASTVSYMYAVDSRNGDPITFSLYRGGRADCKAVIEMIGWLTAYDIKVGVIVDRGFATKEVYELFDQNEIEYVAMLKGDTRAHADMLERYASKIRMQYEYMLGRYRAFECVNSSKEFVMDSHILYGTEETEKVPLFSAHDYQAYVSVVYDSANGGERQETWFKKVSNIALNIQRKLNSGKKVSVPKEYTECISIEERSGKQVVMVNEYKVQESGNRKGFYTLASSKPLKAQDANEIYRLRNSSEEQFSMVKSQLAYDTTGTHYIEGIKVKLTLAFIAAIVRNELVKACKESSLSTNKIVNELNQICMHMNGKDEYFVCHTENQRQVALMKACKVITKDLDSIAEAENKRLASIEANLYHHYPIHPEESETSYRGVGRPKGSRNKPKADAEVQKRKRGRPKKRKLNCEISAKNSNI